MTNRPDHSGAVLGTVFGLFAWALQTWTGFLLIWMVIVVLFGTSWGWIVAVALIVPVVIALIVADVKSQKVVKAHEQRHFEKYGRKAEPWKTHPIHRSPR